MELVIDAQDVALSLIGPGERVTTGVAVPDGKVCLAIHQGVNSVFVVGRLSELHGLVETGLSIPLTSQILHDFLDAAAAESDPP